jgi:tRNA nucleotidyltransferase/poly(A) polymerase
MATGTNNMNKIDNWNKLLTENPLLVAGREVCVIIQSIFPDSEALMVGGCVRDLLLGKKIHDIDIATNIDTSKLTLVFPCHDIGKNKDFGIIVIKHLGFIFEVAQYRNEFGTSDCRHPDKVNFVKSFKDDSARRDFTINSLGLTINGEIIDHHGGYNDIQNRVIRAVGNPVDRFKEDALRILRCLRFSSVLDFDIEEKTHKAIYECRDLVDKLSKERITEELIKVASRGSVLADYIEMLDNCLLLARILPEVSVLKGKIQSEKHHPEGDAFQHTMAALRYNKVDNPAVNLSILFHDIGKGTTYVNRDGKHTYYNHDIVGSHMIKEIGKRLKLSNELTDTLEYCAEKHMVFHGIHKMKRSKITELVNNDKWPILKTVAQADDLCRFGVCDEQAFNTKIANAEAIAREISDGGGVEGLKLKLKNKINGTALMAWIPELNENKKLIGSIITKVQEWIINNNYFDKTEEEIKTFALESFNCLKVVQKGVIIEMKTESSELVDPVHFKLDGYWYFWNETKSEELGPYDTEVLARAGLKEYCIKNFGEIIEST